MKNLETAKKILGMEIHRDRNGGTLFLSQKKYIEKVLECFSMQNSKPIDTPLATYFKLLGAFSPQTKKEVEYMSNVPYASAVGSLMYAIVCTRPDIAHDVSVVSRYMANPKKVHQQSVKWILRYLKGTTDVHLVYENFKDIKSEIVGYVDSYYAGDLDK